MPGPGGFDSGGEDHPSNNPIYSLSAARNAALVSDELLVVFPGPDTSMPLPGRQSRGVLVYSLADRLAPELLSETPLQGYALQMLPGTDSVTIVAQVPRELSSGEIPLEPVSDNATRLMRFDLSQPAAPQLVASLELEGQFWEVTEKEGQLFVLSQVAKPAVADCDGLNYESSQAASTASMRVSSYGFTGDEFALVAQVDLAGDGYVAYGTELGFVSVLGNYDGAPTFSLARLGAGGALDVSSAAPLSGEVNAMSSLGDLLAVVTLTDGTPRVTLFDAADLADVKELSSVALPQQVFSLKATNLLAEPAFVGDGWLLRVLDPSQPELVPIDQVARILPAQAGLMALGQADNGTVAVSTWELGAGLSPVLTASLSTGFPFNPQTAAAVGFNETSGTLYYPYGIDHGPTGGGQTTHIGVAALSDGASGSVAPVALGEVIVGGSFGPMLVDDQGAHLIGYDGFQSLTLEPELTASTPAPFYGAVSDVALDRRATEAGEFVLVRRGDAVFLLYPAADGAAPRELELPHFATELVLHGTTLIAAGLSWSPDCELYPEVPELELMCPKPLQRGLTLVSVDDLDRVARTLLIDSSLDAPPLPADSEQTTNWLGYLHRGQLIFPVTRQIHCHTVGACEALGLPWYTGMATPGCPDGDCPPEELQPFETVDGYGHESMLYVIDPASAESFGEPIPLGHGVNLEQTLHNPAAEDGGPLDLRAFVVESDTSIGFPTDQPVYNAQGNSVSNAYGESLHRFGVELVDVDAQGALTPRASVSTPGRVVALSGSYLYAVAPSHQDAEHIAALLHRLRVEKGGALIEQTLDLGTGFRDAIAAGNYAYFLLGPETYCYSAAAERTTELVGVDLEALSLARGGSLTLPWDSWSFDRSAGAHEASSIMLSGGPAGYRGRAEIAVSSGQPVVASYFMVAP